MQNREIERLTKQQKERAAAANKLAEADKTDGTNSSSNTAVATTGTAAAVDTTEGAVETKNNPAVPLNADATIGGSVVTGFVGEYYQFKTDFWQTLQLIQSVCVCLGFSRQAI